MPGCHAVSTPEANAMRHRLCLGQLSAMRSHTNCNITQLLTSCHDEKCTYFPRIQDKCSHRTAEKSRLLQLLNQQRGACAQHLDSQLQRKRQCHKRMCYKWRRGK